MAQPPRNRRTGSDAAKALEQRYAAAAQAATEAATFVAEVSSKHLTGLLRASLEKRFAALAETGSVLTPDDRAKLLASLKGQAAPSRPISATTASRWAIFRSRLPYRVVPIAIRAFSGVAFLGLGLLAWHRTPEQWVTIKDTKAATTQWRLPDGTMMARSPTTDTRYALLRRDGQIGVVRAWLPGRGYAEARVPIDDLQAFR